MQYYTIFWLISSFVSCLSSFWSKLVVSRLQFYILVILLFQDSRKIFHSLVSLVIHHSVMPESLPCPLVLSCDFGDFGSNPGFSNQKLWHSYPQPPTNNRDHDFADTDLADYSSLVMTLRKSISSSTSDISLTSSLPDWDKKTLNRRDNSIWNLKPLCKLDHCD